MLTACKFNWFEKIWECLYPNEDGNMSIQTDTRSTDSHWRTFC